jgi:amino acid transporter
MAMPVGLRRVLKFRTIVSTSAGLAFAAISFLGCVQLAAYLAGDSSWIAMLVAGILALLAALCFSELSGLYPSAAAIRLYMRNALNERTALIVTFGYMLTIVAVIAADSYVVGSAIQFVFPVVPAIIWILVLLALAMGANLRGIRIAGLVQDITTYALLLSAVAISLIALSRHGFHLHAPFAALRSPANLFNAVAVGVFVFAAFEWVTPLAEEITDYQQIPHGMFVALGLLFVAYSLFTVAATNLVPIHTLVHSAVPQMLLAQAALGKTGIAWMLIATIFTGMMTFNGGFATASRFLYAAAREATLPPIFARISIAYAVPYMTIIALTAVSAAIAIVVALTGQFQELILVGAVLEAMIYAVAGICVIQLRRRQAEAPRSFRIPGGYIIPALTTIIFTTLAIGAATTPNAIPLAVTAGIFTLSTLYVMLVVPRLKAKAAARRGPRRRPQRSHPVAEAADQVRGMEG